MKIKIYTDGSCLGNPGPGGWAYIVKVGEDIYKEADGEVHTTNNRMELMAVIQAFRMVSKKFPKADHYEVYSDSAWVVNTMSKNWKRKKNLDLWAELAPLIFNKRIDWIWVRGHAGHPENEDCDERAQEQAQKYKKRAPKLTQIIKPSSPSTFQPKLL